MLQKASPFKKIQDKNKYQVLILNNIMILNEKTRIKFIVTVLSTCNKQNEFNNNNCTSIL